ncbi:hypothetical protein F5884DRAFT_899540 [Xylogone sp. PMI_703]|nr:hypothetical protein F5884DRAFT_899540 [Xylogone sp. PMI_703]
MGSLQQNGYSVRRQLSPQAFHPSERIKCNTPSQCLEQDIPPVAINTQIHDTYKQRLSRNSHTKRSRDIPSSVINGRMYICSLKECEREFKRPDNLRRHEEKHRRIHRCSERECSRRRFTREELQTHMAEHKAVVDRKDAIRAAEDTRKMISMDSSTSENRIYQPSSDQLNMFATTVTDVTRLNLMGRERLWLNSQLAAVNEQLAAVNRRLRESSGIQN